MEDNKPLGSAESAIGAPNIQTEFKPKRSPRPSRAKPKAEAATASKEAEKMFEITLHDSKEIPPNGQLIGVNGRQIFLKPGVRRKVPASFLEVLDNAVQALPEVNEKLQVIGMRNAPRLTYTLHREA